MRTHTDSSIIEYHEDGSWTTTTTVTEHPATTAQKAVAGGVLAAVCVAPFVPVLLLVCSSKLEKRREAKRLKSQSEEN